MRCLLLVLLTASLNLFGEVLNDIEIEKFTQRIRLIEKFKNETISEIQKNLESNIEILKKYQDQKLLSADKMQLALYQGIMEDELNELETKVTSIDTNYSKIKLSELVKLKEKRRIYLDAEKKKKEMQGSSGDSKNLKKYYELLQSLDTIDDVKAHARYVLLSKEERVRADSFKENYFYLLRESGVQDSIEKEIVDTENEIEERLKFPEQAIASVLQSKKNADQAFDNYRNFSAKLDTLEQFEIDLQAGVPRSWNWSYGQFNCDPAKNPTYQRLKYFPDLIILGNGDTRAVIKINKNKPKEFQKLYSCKQSGKITGGCLDNTEKELCNLDLECKSSLDLAEKAFDLDESFKHFKLTIISQIIKKQDTDNFNGKGVLGVIRENKKKGDYTLSELQQKFQLMAMLVKDIRSDDPIDFYAKVDKSLAQFLMDEKSKPRWNEGNNHLLIEYMVNSFMSEFEAIKKNDFVQDLIYKQCPVELVSFQRFCFHYTDFKKRSSFFQETEILTNLTPNECPKITFRTPKDVSLFKAEDCSDSSVTESIDSLLKINRELKNKN